MKRRAFLEAAAAVSLLPVTGAAASRTTGVAGPPFTRVRPGDADWPSAADWERLRTQVGGRLIAVQSPVDACRTAPDSPACGELFRELKNPYYIGDSPALTQTSGWADAWESRPSVYAVAAETTADVVAAVNFARTHRLRLVVKGGGHSYQGTSCAPDSLLVWTRAMHQVTLYDAFVGQGCPPTAAQPAVSLGAGTIWMQAYQAVTVQGGRYVQGGGCTTVGVAGLIQSGGFGNFSKRYGTAAAGLIEAEVVTADGVPRVVNACTEPELFWALKGGGGGSLGVITRLTLRTHELPTWFGAAFGSVMAKSDQAFRALIARLMLHYRDHLFDPHWGESIRLSSDNMLHISMVVQGLDQAAAEAAWAPFVEWVKSAPDDYSIEAPIGVLVIPAQRIWDVDFLNAQVPGVFGRDDRPGAPPANAFWAGDQEQAGQFLHGYRSAWLPASLLGADQQDRLADALFACSRRWGFSLHFNKGLAGAPAAEIAAARDTATNPDVLDAFALAIIASEGPPAFREIPGHEPDLPLARDERRRIDQAMAELLAVAPGRGSYVSESDYFETDWQRSFWGPNYPRLAAAKRRYDPEGLFFVHHGVGSERWSADGFTRLT